MTKGIAEAYVKVGGNAPSGATGGDGKEEEKVKGIISTGKLFGYTKFLAAFLEEDMAVKAFTQLYVSRSTETRPQVSRLKKQQAAGKVAKAGFSSSLCYPLIIFVDVWCCNANDSTGPSF